MPAYANADGKIVVFFQNAGKFSYRYSTLGFQDTANQDDGDVWPVTYALKKWSPRGGEESRRAGQGRNLLTGSPAPAGTAQLPARAPSQRRPPAGMHGHIASITSPAH
jgi:hypothetical protein